jgi:hypothetical protein
MACTAEGYARMGGMNQRGAGEDFYFLQHLAKTGGVSQVKGTVVYPSARASHRVPFGTGRSMTDLLSRKEGAVLFYRMECFQILADWLALVGERPEWEGNKLQGKTLEISSYLFNFLIENRFESVWEKLQRNFRDSRNLLKGFHDWFDGLEDHEAHSSFIRRLSLGRIRSMSYLPSCDGLVWSRLKESIPAGVAA